MLKVVSTAYGEDEFYKEFISRNGQFIDAMTQGRIKELKIFVAGCGSAGGACIEPLVRLGVTQFRLADNGDYELSNLNRQHAFVDSIGKNKAVFHEGEIRRINPYADVKSFKHGVTQDNVSHLVEWADLIFDCVDVTTVDAIAIKLLLHEKAGEIKKPVFSMLDLGFCQWGIGFDYRKDSQKILDGRLTWAKKGGADPIKVLMRMFPLSAFPAHSLSMIVELIEDRRKPASQLECSANLLSAAAAAGVVRFAKDGKLITGWNLSVDSLGMTLMERFRCFLNAPFLYMKIALWRRSASV